MKQRGVYGAYEDAHWWDAGGWIRRRVVSPVIWRAAGVRDRVGTWRANRKRDIVS